MTYFHIVQEFIESQQQCDTDRASQTLFDNFSGSLGCQYFSCISHAPFDNMPKDAITIVKYPEKWVEHFIDNRFDLIDPILTTVTRSTRPWQWNDKRWRARLRDDQREILYMAHDFGLQDGYTIPIFGRHCIPASISLVHDRDIDPEALNALHLMSLYLFEEAVKRREGPKRSARDSILSRQQKRCLELVAQGKSDWAIGVILSISHHTATSHVTAAMRRLGVATRIQAVIRAFTLGEIRFHDLKAKPKSRKLAAE